MGHEVIPDGPELDSRMRVSSRASYYPVSARCQNEKAIWAFSAFAVGKSLSWI
jgi:hypothetical protein